MEANNHFNYGPHSSVSANSGLKLSSGDSLYTNGSSMNFPQQGKNINGDMNVNGITTAIGTSQTGPHPPSSSYPHMTNHHHQGSMAYDYLWGQTQYSPAMSSGPTHAMHQKQGSPGVLQQNQHHFQSHGQYQVNGAMGTSHQTPVGAAPNVSLGAGQYWNRPNPTQQQGGASMAMGYNSHSVYGGYQSQVHPGLSPAQHHQQSPMTHQGPPTHHHPHHPHPHHPHAHHHPQQQQHYGMVPNGMPYYQHQPQHPPQHPPLPSPQPQHPAQHQPLPSPQPQHPAQHQSLPSPQPQHPPTHQQLASPQPQHPPQHQTLPSPQHQTLPSPQHPPQHQPLSSPQPQHAPQPQSQMMPPTSQNFTPPRGSPQHHHIGRGATGSPLPMQVPMMSPSAIPDGGSPQSRDSPLGSSLPLPSVMQGRLGDTYKEVDKGYNGVERSSVAQRLPKADGYPTRPSAHLLVPTSDYCQRVPHGGMDVEPLHKQRHDMGGPMREAMHPAMSAPPPLLSTPPRQASSGPPVVSVHHMTASEPPSSSAASASAPPQVGAKTPHGSPVSAPAPMLSSPPLMVQGLRPMPGAMSPSSLGGGPPELMPTASSMSGPPPLMGHGSRTAPVPAPPPAVTSPSQVVSTSHPSAPATSAPPLWTSAPPVSAFLHSQMAYVPPQMVQAPKLQETSKPHSPVSSPSKVAQTHTTGELSPVSAPPVVAPALPSGVSAASSSPPEAPASSSLSSSPQKARAPSSSMLSSSLPDAVSGRAPAAGALVTVPPATTPVSTPPPVVAAPHRAASVPPAAASSPPVVSAAPQAASVSLPTFGAPPPGAAAPPKAVSALPAVSAPTQAVTAPPGGSMPPLPPPQPVSGLPAVSTTPQAGSAPSVSVPPPASEAASSPPQAAGQASQGSDQQDSSDAGTDFSHKAASKKEVRDPQFEKDVAVNNSSKSDPTQAPHSRKSPAGPSDVSTGMSGHKANSPARNLWPETGKSPAPVKDQDTPRKTASFDDTLDESLDCSSMAELTHIESSRAEDTSIMEGTFDDSMADTSYTDEPSMFTEDSATEDSRQVTADDTQDNSDLSQVDETMDSCLSTRESGTEDDSSQLKDSVSDDSQNDLSQMAADDHDLSKPPGKGPDESEDEESKEKDVDDGRDAPDCAGVPAAAAVKAGTAGTPVSADEGWQETVAAAATDPSPAEQAAKPLPLSTSAVTVATTPPPQKPAAKRARAQATAKQGTQASRAAQKKTPAKAPKEEKEKRKRKKNEDKEPPGTRKKRKLSKDDASDSAIADTILAVSTAGAGKTAADQSLVTSQTTPAKPKKIRKPKGAAPAAGTGATTSPKTEGDHSLESGQTPPAKPKKIRKPRQPKVKDGAAKPTKAAKTPKAAKTAKAAKAEPKETPKADQDNEDEDEGSTTGETQKRRIATEEQVHFPLLHGWKREVRVKKHEDRLKGETWYYSPCGRRMKQFPEIIKYLRRHECGAVTREHFSFSPRMPVGDFYEERESPEGMKWFLLANEEVPSIIMAITGRRGRPPNPDKEKPRARVRRPKGTPGRRPGRPPKTNAVDLLSKVDARMLKRLQAKEVLTDEDKEKMGKIKKKMKRKARLKRKEDTKNKIIRQEKRKAKLEKAKEANDQQQDEGKPAQPGQPQSQVPSDQQTPQPATEPKKPGRKKRVQTPEEMEKAGQVKRVAGARSQAKALAKAQAEAEAKAQAALTAKKQAERRAQAQRRLEERKKQQQILEEMKKPTEDMCINDHQPLPELSRIPGVVLSGRAFSHCLEVVEFLHSYGKVLGLQIPKDVPSLSTLQEGLLGVGESQNEVMDLLIKLVEAALHDPGLPSYYQSVKILGEKLVDLELSHRTVSECLRIFLESHGFEVDVCNTLRTKTFQALKPDVKASILAFLVEELNASNTVTRDIDNTLENMSTYRKNKWIIEGKLRKLKAALVRRTGRSEEELCLEDRRRSTRAGMAEEESLEETTMLDRSSRRGRGVREEPKLTEAESPTNASIPELERQIDKLAKRQVFFRKKLQQASHSLRAVSLGQDRYRRRYWLMPHMGAILVEGPEEVLDSGDILLTDEPMVYPKKEVKVEVKSEEPLSPINPAATAATPRSCSPRASGSSGGGGPLTEVDPLPGEASLMSSSSPRGRGRPRKIKPEVELHLRTAKNRRRRRSSKSGGEEPSGDATAKLGTQDLTQAAFTAWLNQAQVDGAQDPATAAAVLAAVAAGGKAPEDGSLSEEAIKELAEKQAQWFHLLPKKPCDASGLSEPGLPSPNAISSLKESPTSPIKGAPPSTPSLQAALTALTQTPLQIPIQPGALPPGVATLLPLLPGSVPVPPACSTPVQKPTRRRRRGSSPARRPYSRPSTGKRRGRPPSTLFQEIEQKYLTQLVVKPIPKEMVRGWWWVKQPEELTAILQALHPRGVREKVLHKHLTKHLEFLSEVCSRPSSDPVFKRELEKGSSVLDILTKPWPEMHKCLQADINALQWVEDLEQRVLAADLHLKMAPQSGKSNTEGNTEEPVAGFQAYTVPEPDSTREDLEFYEHEVDPRDDWIVRTKREWSDLLRVPNNPVDLAVHRLANLERNIERRYLKEPLWNLAEVMRLAPLTPPPGEEVPMDVVSLEMEITPRLRTWRQGLDRCRSAAQLSLCVLQLERAIAWEKSVVKVTCQVCHKGDNDEYLLLCDGCDRGCHMFCLRPKVTDVPDGDWFCPICVSKMDEGGMRPQRSARQRARRRKRRLGAYGPESSEEEESPRRLAGMSTRQKDGPSSSASSTNGTSGISPSKRRRMTTRNQPDLTYCEIILMEMEAHADAWPFQEPVNPRLVPGYRRIIKNPMDFLTMRERLLQGGYCSVEEFAADAHLVFNNCELFNEDTSDVGKAGHAMRLFFESRWSEFYQTKDKEKDK